MKPALGVCYYPEHWPRAWWADDARRMARNSASPMCGSANSPGAGSSRSRARFELRLAGPRDGRPRQAHGLKVVLGTPTATPPRWLIDKHPDMLPVDADGRPRNSARAGTTASRISGYRGGEPRASSRRSSRRATASTRACRLADRQRVRLPRHGRCPIRAADARRLPRLAAGGATRRSRR